MDEVTIVVVLVTAIVSFMAVLVGLAAKLFELAIAVIRLTRTLREERQVARRREAP